MPKEKMNEEEFDQLVYEFFANYQDQGMKKWGGFRVMGDKNDNLDDEVE